MRTLAKERPPRSAGLVFGDELALAILDGQKTETRRPLAPRVTVPNLRAGDSVYGRVTYIPGVDCEPTYRFMLDGYMIDELSKTHNWTPAIHMPKIVAPFLCTLTEVLDEPLQNITEEQAKSEGVGARFVVDLASFVHGGALPPSTYLNGFRSVWREIYGSTKMAWDNNPTVRVFRWKDIKLHESLIGQVRPC
jgi:hypothetical protein